MTLLGTGRFDEAKIYARKAVEWDSTFYSTVILAGAQNSLAEENYDDAIIFLDLLIELGFNTHDIWRSKAKALTMKKRFEKALTCYDTATEINPHDYETLVERALLLEMLGRNKEAIAGLEEATKVDVRSTQHYKF